MKVLLINSDYGPDYLADLINYYFISNSHEVFTNHRLDFMFNDFKNKSDLYGKGFTLYGKLESSLKSSVSVLTKEEILDSVKKYDLILFTSIQRNFKNNSLKSSFFNPIKKTNPNKEIYVIDGEDHQLVDENIASKSKYFKRELTEKYKSKASPISFCFPENELPSERIEIKDKTQLLAPMDPRFLNSYIYDEQGYYEQYSKSIFGTTIKKAGWDCMRHYEILSVNTLLFFPGIEDKPNLTMINFPSKLQIEINKLFKKLILNEQNVDSLEQIRLRYYTKNRFLGGIKRASMKLSKINILENNINKLEKLNLEFQNWFIEEGLTSSYDKLFK